MSNESYEPDLKTIAKVARQIREEGFTVERTGQRVEPWSEKRYGAVREYEFPRADDRGYWQD